jgi:protein-tyrosine phosphatase
MIDIHSHVLWGVDDGVRTLEESVAILRDAAAAGTTAIVATPHANDEFKFDPDLIGSRIAELRGRPERLPRIYSGCDFHLSASNIEDALRNPAKYTINGKRYLLVEFPDMFISPATEQILALLAGRGMTPVITHPERNPALRRDIARLRGWAERGYLLQVTALSLLDRFGNSARESAWELVESGAAHVVASDAHHPEDRHARLDDAYRAVAARAGEERAEMLCVVNPGAVVEGYEVMPSSPLERPRKWYQLWR